MENGTSELTRDDLLQILGVKNENLKYIIKTKKLKERLSYIGYIYWVHI